MIDTSGFILRCVHGSFRLPQTTFAGEPCGGVLTFLRSLDATLAELRPTYVLFALDGPRHLLQRRVMDPEYKAHREPLDEVVQAQFDMCMHVLRRLRVAKLGVKGWEADDIIASFVDICEGPGKHVTIVSRDKDLHQLLGPGVEQYDPKNGTVTAAKARDRWGVPRCELIADVQALCGDATDGVAGLHRVGPVIAAQLVNRFGSAVALHDNLLALPPGIRRQLASFDIAKSLELVRMRRDLRLKISLKRLIWRGLKRSRIHQAFQDLRIPVSMVPGN